MNDKLFYFGILHSMKHSSGKELPGLLFANLTNLDYFLALKCLRQNHIYLMVEVKFLCRPLQDIQIQLYSVYASHLELILLSHLQRPSFTIFHIWYSLMDNYNNNTMLVVYLFQLVSIPHQT